MLKGVNFLDGTGGGKNNPLFLSPQYATDDKRYCDVVIAINSVEWSKVYRVTTLIILQVHLYQDDVPSSAV